jgi:hypothetical protein
MFKQLLICAALIVFATSAANAQQREAVLQTVEVPGAAFDLVLAIPKTPAAIVDLGGSPEALVMHLVGGELALVFESAEQMVKTADSLRSPVGAFHVQRNGINSAIAVAVYMVPKGGILASAEK